VFAYDIIIPTFISFIFLGRELYITGSCDNFKYSYEELYPDVTLGGGHVENCGDGLQWR
jgi:hypothetical protein